MNWYFLRRFISIWLIPIFIGSFIYFFAETEIGLNTLFWLTTKFIPGQLSVKHLQGQLLKTITLEGLVYQNDLAKLSVMNARINWNLAELLKKKIVITYCFIDQLKLSIPFNKTANPSFTWPSWIKFIEIKSAQIHSSSILYHHYDLRLQGGLRSDQQWDLTWMLNLNDIADFFPSIQTAIFLKGRVVGNRFQPQCHIWFNTNNWFLKDSRISPMRGTLFFTLGTTTIDWKLAMSVSLAEMNSLLFRPLNLTMHGTWNPLRMQAVLMPVTIIYRQENQRPFTYLFPQINFSASSTEKGLALMLHGEKAKSTVLDANLLLPHYQADRLLSPQQSLQARIHVDTNQLNLLQRFIPMLERVKGWLSVDTQITGLWKKLKINSAMLIYQASAALPSFGLSLQDIQINARLSEKTIQWLGRTKLGSHYLYLQGTTQLTDPTLLTSLSTSGKDITISNTSDTKIIATPKLQIKMSTKKIEVQGNLFVSHAVFNTEDAVEAGLMDLPSDVIFTDRKKETPKISWPLYAKIQLHFLEDVQLIYQHLKAKMKGNLTIYDEPNRSVRGFGQLNLVEGQYKYGNQTLTLQKNSYLLFSGNSLDNPTINIMMSRQVKVSPNTTYENTNNLSITNFSSGFFPSVSSSFPITITVGLDIHGSARKPQIHLFAEPPVLSQAEILSCLLTGQIQGMNLESLFSLTAYLAGGHNPLSHLASSLQKQTILDQFSIQANPIINPATGSFEQNTSIVLGKALSPKLYVSYSFGIVQPVSILQINYLLNRYFSVQASTSTYGNGIDLLFKKEK